MTHLTYSLGRDHLLALVDCASKVLQIRESLVDTLSPYSESAACALADVLEVISAIATDLTPFATNDDKDECQTTLGEEPYSFDDAVLKLPGFLAHAAAVFTNLSEASDVAVCEVSVRAQTFAFSLRPGNVE
jgi:hypothetical protein